jgi:hypothetical protein
LQKIIIAAQVRLSARELEEIAQAQMAEEGEWSFW